VISREDDTLRNVDLPPRPHYHRDPNPTSPKDPHRNTRTHDQPVAFNLQTTCELRSLAQRREETVLAIRYHSQLHAVSTAGVPLSTSSGEARATSRRSRAHSAISHQELLGKCRRALSPSSLPGQPTQVFKVAPD